MILADLANGMSELAGLLAVFGVVASVVWCVAAIKQATALLRADIVSLTASVDRLSEKAGLAETRLSEVEKAAAVTREKLDSLAKAKGRR